MKHSRTSLGRRISDFCRARVERLYPPREAERITHYLLDLVRLGQRPPTRGQEFDCAAIAQACGLNGVIYRRTRQSYAPSADRYRAGHAAAKAQEGILTCTFSRTDGKRASTEDLVHCSQRRF